MCNNIIKPYNSEVVVILTRDNKYTVKIYSCNYLKSMMFFNIIIYL